MKIDTAAREEAIQKFAMPASLLLPISARNREAISNYVGIVLSELCSPGLERAFLVEVPKPKNINPQLSVWKMPNSKILHASLQVWVHVDYKYYRSAYQQAFPEENLSSLVLDHIHNRRMAKVMGFNYVRIVPISRGANSSSGTLAEQWGIDYHSTLRMRKINSESKSSIKYADLSDMTKMLDIKTGGGFMDAVNKAKKLLS